MKYFYRIDMIASMQNNVYLITWHIKPKDIKQTNELKKCKNAGCNAYFLICFENKDVRMVDVDDVIDVLKQNKKSIKNINLNKWDLLEEIKKYEKIK